MVRDGAAVDDCLAVLVGIANDDTTPLRNIGDIERPQSAKLSVCSEEIVADKMPMHSGTRKRSRPSLHLGKTEDARGSSIDTPCPVFW